jgi:hypothetical protein
MSKAYKITWANISRACYTPLCNLIIKGSQILLRRNLIKAAQRVNAHDYIRNSKE